ncbi:uncharacterized protein LOC142983010 [Anticarsia gemmatalis]|uniref:uncharacterized protein LOC142983010 n=1 Tax=Anticarsia gemmatalis TaxID=129554 RepID=UPI003F762CD4
MKGFIVVFLWFKVYECTEITGDWCGKDKSNATQVYEGFAHIETYPWMGLLIYPHDADLATEKQMSTTVVLITTILALAMALEVDKYPKTDFRSRVILGHNCSGPFLKIKEYIFHPDFGMNYYSSLAIVQLHTIRIQDYIPICPPPNDFVEAEIYAITMTHECEPPMLRIWRMEYVTMDECRDYYRRNDLDIASLWPRHTSCARSLYGDECLWRSGTVLVTKQNGRWSLLGVGVYGPGCGAPARFLDYDNYYNWIQNTVDRIGKVSVTRMSPGHLILRRSTSHLQRYGPCDPEEVQQELFSDHTEVVSKKDTEGVAVYNLTLYAKMDYSCLSLRLWPMNNDTSHNATLRLKRWCRAKTPLCTTDSFITIFLYVEIKFKTSRPKLGWPPWPEWLFEKMRSTTTTTTPKSPMSPPDEPPYNGYG